MAGVTVTAPNGGENWCVGTTQSITWKSDGVENVKLEYSTNNGTNWNVISPSTSASAGSFSWAIPQGVTPGSSNQVRISDASKSTRNDVSNNTFALAGQATITTQPVADEVCTGESFAMSVEVTGSGHQYQWRRNGQDVIGATNGVWGTYQLSDGDVISVVLYSDYKCPNPDSIENNKLIVNLKLGIESLVQNHFSLFLSPIMFFFVLKGVATQ